jgi:hypothetical protein
MGRVQLLTCGIVSKVEQLQTNKTYMNKDFEVGSFLKQDDYTTYNQMGLMNWSRLSEQKFRVDKWSLCRVRPPRGAAED